MREGRPRKAKNSWKHVEDFRNSHCYASAENVLSLLTKGEFSFRRKEREIDQRDVGREKRPLQRIFLSNSYSMIDSTTITYENRVVFTIADLHKTTYDNTRLSVDHGNHPHSVAAMQKETLNSSLHVSLSKFVSNAVNTRRIHSKRCLQASFRSAPQRTSDECPSRLEAPLQL